MEDPSAIPAAEQVVESLIAADGSRLHPSATSLADFVRMLEDGQFDADVTYDLRELNTDMEEMFRAHGGKLKAALSIKIEMTREIDGFYMIAAKYDIKRPQEARPRSVAWLTDQNLFTPNKPNQGSLFGVRDVSPRRNVRN